MVSRYKEAFDYLNDFPHPRRKFAPRHWLTTLYFFAVKIGDLMYRIVRRNPLVVLWRGSKEGFCDE